MALPRIGLVTLGVEDFARAKSFYMAMGLRPSSASTDGISFFDIGTVVLALYGHAALAEDAGVPVTVPGFRGVTLAWNVASEAEADAALAQAIACGARLVKPAQRVFWGGYSGYFADPDGHLWEVAYNPFFGLQPNGRVELP